MNKFLRARILNGKGALTTRDAQIALILLAGLVVIFTMGACSGPVATSPDGSDIREEAIEEPRGLRVKEDGATPGYVLFSPLLSGVTYLIDENGQVVHTWESDYAPSGSVYFRDNGNIVRTARVPEVDVFKAGGQGGRIEEFNWEGELVWEFEYYSPNHLLHHDIQPLPNGNFLAISYERKGVEEAQKAGRRIDLLPEAGLWPDKIIEIEPTRPSGGRIVWEWRTWDHLIQDVDPDADNYGDPAKQPWKVNVNGDGKLQEISPEELEQLQALGYVPSDADSEDLSADFMHTNAIDHNAELDQIVVSVPRFNEIWVIDHSTTTEEAAESTGGRYGRGGDLLYRWGNPRTYGRGEEADQKLFAQHDVRWIPDGFPGAGNLTVFNNALKNGDDSYSAVIEISPPVGPDGSYELTDSGPFGSPETAWTYQAPDLVSFHSGFISGAERLRNGNTLICSGAQGRFFEVTPGGQIVWEYWTLFSGGIKNPDGTPPHPVGEATYAVFRATKVPPDHPALEGKDLSPLDPQPEPVKGPEVPEDEG